MTMITPSYLGETIEYSSLHACRSTLEDPTGFTPASQGGTHIVERNLTRVTVVLGVLFFANSITLFHYLS